MCPVSVEAGHEKTVAALLVSWHNCFAFYLATFGSSSSSSSCSSSSSWRVTHTRPCHFLHFSAVRLRICEVSVVWSTSDFQGSFRGGRKFLLFCFRRFALAFVVLG